MIKRIQIAPMAASAIGGFVAGSWLVFGFDPLAFGSVTMKFATAEAMFVAGICGAVAVSSNVNVAKENQPYGIALAVACSAPVLLSLAAWLFTGSAGGAEQVGAVDSVAPNVPSVGTGLGFLLFSVAWFLRLKGGSLRASRLASRLAGILGAIAILGHTFGVPEAYWRASWSTAVSLHTGIGFALLSLPDWINHD